MMLYQAELKINGEWKSVPPIFEMMPKYLSHFMDAYNGDMVDGAALTINELRLKRFTGERPDITMVYDGKCITGTHLGVPIARLP